MNNTGVECRLAFSGEALAWYAGVHLREYYLDAEAAYTVATEGPRIVREKFGLEIGPQLMGMSYNSLLPVGAEVTFMDDGSPHIAPCLARLEDFLRWEEYHPFDSSLTQRLLSVWRAVDARLGGGKIGFPYGNEAPFTAAVLLRGMDFFLDLQEHPALAHALLDRLTDHWLAANAACRELADAPATGGGVWLGDDYSGLVNPALFREFVLPTYRRIFAETRAEHRVLHSELLRPEHLPLLAGLELDLFDPHVDQYLTPADLQQYLPAGTPWLWRIITSHLLTHTPDELIAEYEESVHAGATAIQVVVMPYVPDENIMAILRVSRVEVGG